MKTKLIILGLLISCVGFGQVYSLDGGGSSALVDTNIMATRRYVDSIAVDIVAGELDLTGYLEWGDTLTKVATKDDIIDLITLGDLPAYLLGEDTVSLSNRIDSKQATLVSGTNIKTINSQSLLGSGDITIEGTGGGTVTSIALSAPTGLTVSGSPVTTSGTLGLSFTSGYSIPTDANQSNWSTAYGWGNHASAGYASNQDISDSIAAMTIGADIVTEADTIFVVKNGTLSVMPIKDIVMITDTFSIFTFGAGGGIAGDTSVFSTGYPYLGSFTNGKDTLVITGIDGSLIGDANDTLSFQMMWADTVDAVSFTTLLTNPVGVTRSGNAYTSFAENKIPPGSKVWARVPSVVVGRKPTHISVTLYGYKIRNY